MKWKGSKDTEREGTRKQRSRETEHERERGKDQERRRGWQSQWRAERCRQRASGGREPWTAKSRTGRRPSFSSLRAKKPGPGGPTRALKTSAAVV